MILGERGRELGKLNRFDLYLKERVNKSEDKLGTKRNSTGKKGKKKNEEPENERVEEEIVLSDTEEDDPDFEVIEMSKRCKYI